MMRRFPSGLAASLLFGSGLCALIYQIVWLRELRLVFGASTGASAAVLAIFMGGLGAGGLLLGRRADLHRNPLRLYARLELAVTLGALASPFLLALVRRCYAWSGGSVTLGFGPATLLRMLLAGLVLALPTVLMGGTLPAMARAIEDRGDPRRRRLALLYGTNTLGAVLGVMLSTFFLLEKVGTLRTLLAACIVNAGIGLVASVLSRSTEPRDVAETDSSRGGATDPAPADDGGGNGVVDRAAFREVEPDAPRRLRVLVPVAAALVGFAFFLMELVWYRMLAPLLGGTTYTFGLILAVALLGIGTGGLAYVIMGRRRPATPARLAATCSLEALFLAVPFAMGDRLAVATALLQRPGPLAFSSMVALWVGVTLVVVAPAAVVAGYQFPLLIAVLGEGGRRVGSHTGLVYAANTGGAVAGALAGGFGLLPLLGAPGAWRLAVVLLVAGACAAALWGPVRPGVPGRAPGTVSTRRWRRRGRFLAGAGSGVVALALILQSGPSAVWRHGSIGAGRFPDLRTVNELRNWIRSCRSEVLWEVDGIESSLAVIDSDALAFMVNGKTDGNARYDAGTQVMSGLLGAFLHEDPRRALVVGLGTGSTAGWLAAVPGMERVDVVELEGRIEAFARQCAPVNHDAMANPKVHLIIGDGREALLTTPERYDLICSEPSNPYRAGIASLYTVEYYRAVASRLREGGLFLQWLQGYEVDLETVKTIVATVADVFPEIELWQTEAGDLQLVCSRRRLVLDTRMLRQRLGEEPYRSGLFAVWRATDLEGVLAHYIANGKFCRELAAAARWGVNTDDRTFVEYAYARTLGRQGLFDPRELIERADAAQQNRPALRHGAVSWGLVREQRWLTYATAGEANWASLVREWQSPRRAPHAVLENLARAEGLAERGLSGAEDAIARIREKQPTEADLLEARLALRRKRPQEAADALARACRALRADPWPVPPVVRRALLLAPLIAEAAPERAPLMLEALRERFAVHLADRLRCTVMARVAQHVSPEATRAALKSLEPHFPQDPELLELRRRVYAATGDPGLERAEAELAAFLEGRHEVTLLDLLPCGAVGVRP